MVGTHALLSAGVQYARLGLVVVDEQHRFGVEQRDQLRSQDAESSPPHVLVMTATPIPRTVAMTVYGDLEVSTLRELPVGRSPIGTTVVPAAEKPQWLGRAWQRVREEVSSGRQAYVVCPRIGDDGDETDELDGDFDLGDSRAGGAPATGVGGGHVRRAARRAARRSADGDAARPDAGRPTRTPPCSRSRPVRSTCWCRPR